MLIVLLMAVIANAQWVLPTSNSDPNSKWTNETYAYDSNMTTYVQATTPTAGSYLNLFHAGVSDCNKIRIYVSYVANKTITVDVNYSDAWHTILGPATSTAGWNTIEIGSSQTVVGMRIEATGTAGAWRVNEAHFWTPSTKEPNTVTNATPADSATDRDIKQTLNWSLAYSNLLYVDNYRVYLGTDTPPTSILEGEVVGIDNDMFAETYNPNGLPPDTTYYWRIDSENDYDVNAGTEWSFTTREGHKVFLPK
jgi:hypothetical protein